MGGIEMGSVVQAVVGVGGAVASSIAAGSQADYMNQMLKQGQGQAARVAGLDEYFLGGGRASKLNVPGFREQFAEVDYALQEQLRTLDEQSEKARQQIADNIPSGGAKLRALAQLSVSTQDARGKVVREAQTKKRDMDVELTNSYLQAAMNRKPGASQDARLWASMRGYESGQADIRAIGSALGSLGEQVTAEKPKGLEYTVPEVEPASTWTAGSDEDWLQPENVPPFVPRKKTKYDITY